MTKDKHKGKFSKKRKVEAEQTDEVVFLTVWAKIILSNI